MNTPKDPTLVDLAQVGVELFEKLTERDHLLDQHRDITGAHPRLADCPAEPCRTWRQFLALYTRWQTGRLS